MAVGRELAWQHAVRLTVAVPGHGQRASQMLTGHLQAGLEFPLKPGLAVGIGAED